MIELGFYKKQYENLTDILDSHLKHVFSATSAWAAQESIFNAPHLLNDLTDLIDKLELIKCFTESIQCIGMLIESIEKEQ